MCSLIWDNEIKKKTSNLVFVWIESLLCDYLLAGSGWNKHLANHSQNPCIYTQKNLEPLYEHKNLWALYEHKKP